MATENEQGQVKNRWTRWYMWLLYVGAVFGVIGIIAGVAGSGDSAVANPEAQAASAQSTPTPEKQAVAGPSTQAEYCEDLKENLETIFQSWDEVTALYGAFSGGPISTNDLKGINKTDSIMDDMEEVAIDILDLNAPEGAGDVDQRSEKLANNLIYNTDQVEGSIADLKRYASQENRQTLGYLLLIEGLIEALTALSKDYRANVIEVAKTGYCEGVTVVR